MKKMINLLVVSLLALSLFGCSSNDEPEVTPTPEVTPETEVTPEVEEPSVSTGMLAVYDAMIADYTDVMPALEVVGIDVAADAFGLTSEYYSELVWAMPLMNVHATIIVIAEATDGNLENVKAEIDNYFEGYEESWATYLPEQYDLVVARQTAEVGNMYVVVVSEYAEDMVAILTNAGSK
ncbi:MAG: DUF4358 domain-containing protein [Erysipelotrichaceae bacterium]